MPPPVPRLYVNPTAARRLLSKLPALQSTGGPRMSLGSTPNSAAAVATKRGPPGYFLFVMRLASASVGSVVGVTVTMVVIGNEAVRMDEITRRARAEGYIKTKKQKAQDAVGPEKGVAKHC